MPSDPSVKVRYEIGIDSVLVWYDGFPFATFLVPQRGEMPDLCLN